MNGRRAKKLRKVAYDMATSPEKKNTKVQIGKQQIWEEGTPKAIYKKLKNELPHVS